jgi:hypothetical protein
LEADLHRSTSKAKLSETPGALFGAESLWGKRMASRECPYCGKMVFEELTQCSFCRETLPEKKQPISTARVPADGGSGIRRGLLFMFLAAVIGYFASPSSPWPLPVQVPQSVANILSPLLFLSGLGLTFYGLYLRHTASH